MDGEIGRRESSAELGERSDKLQCGARTPGQRRAGQLVYLYFAFAFITLSDFSWSYSNAVFAELMGEEDAKAPVLYVGNCL